MPRRPVAAQYRALLTSITPRLSNPKVFRVGDRQVAVYVVGGAGEGRWRRRAEDDGGRDLTDRRPDEL